jgi:hypothetical protein
MSHLVQITLSDQAYDLLRARATATGLERPATMAAAIINLALVDEMTRGPKTEGRGPKFENHMEIYEKASKKKKEEEAHG